VRIPKSVCAIAKVCDPESVRYALSSVLFGRQKKKPFAVATDGRRMVHVTWDEDQLDLFDDEPTARLAELMVHGRVVKEMPALCNGSKGAAKRVLLDESSDKVCVRFSGPNGIKRLVEQQSVEGAFPKWQDVIVFDDSRVVASVRMSGSLLLGTLDAIVAILELEGAQGVTLDLMKNSDGEIDSLRIRGQQGNCEVTAVQMAVSGPEQ
jgi:hypothetical protein